VSRSGSERFRLASEKRTVKHSFKKEQDLASGGILFFFEIMFFLRTVAAQIIRASGLRIDP